MKLIQRAFLIVTCLLIVLTVVAAGDYLGPNRHVRDTYNDIITLEYVSGSNPYGIQYCTLHQG